MHLQPFENKSVNAVLIRNPTWLSFEIGVLVGSSIGDRDRHNDIDEMHYAQDIYKLWS